MKTEKLVQHLSEVVRRIGYKLRTEDGNFRGGCCVFGAERLVILNRRMTYDERAELLARVLAGEEIDALYLIPEVRRYVESFRTVAPLSSEAVSPESGTGPFTSPRSETSVGISE